MNRARYVLLATACTAALAFADTALGAFTPKLFVSAVSQRLGGGGAKISYRALPTDDPTARAAFYVPKDFQVTTGAAPGTQLGTVAATAAALDLGGAVLPLAGNVEVANPADYAAQAQACTQTTVHSATWVLVLNAAGQTLRVPIFVDLIAAASPLSTFAAAQLVICLPPPDVPAGTPGRATFGAKVLTADFSVSAITNPAAPGEFPWRLLATPYTPNVGTVNSAGTVEAQSIVRLPLGVTIKARVRKSSKPSLANVTFSGTFGPRPQSGWAVAGVAPIIDLLRGSSVAGLRKFATLAPDKAGLFGGTFPQKRAKKATTLYLASRATMQEEDLGAAACHATFVPPLSPAPIPCIDATIGLVTIAGTPIRVTIPKR